MLDPEHRGRISTFNKWLFVVRFSKLIASELSAEISPMSIQMDGLRGGQKREI